METPAQHQLLQELGCDTMQGYYFGKPMQREAFELFLLNGAQLLAGEPSDPQPEQIGQEPHLRQPCQYPRKRMIVHCRPLPTLPCI